MPPTFKKITGLPVASSVLATDLIEITHDPSGSPISQKATISQIQIQISVFDSGQVAVPGSAGFVINTAHGLSAAPELVVCTFECVAPDANTGYVAGDILTLSSAINIGNMAVYYNATVVAVATQSFFTGNEASTTFLKEDGSGFSAISSFNNFRFRIRAFLF